MSDLFLWEKIFVKFFLFFFYEYYFQLTFSVSIQKKKGYTFQAVYTLAFWEFGRSYFGARYWDLLIFSTTNLNKISLTGEKYHIKTQCS